MKAGVCRREDMLTGAVELTAIDRGIVIFDRAAGVCHDRAVGIVDRGVPQPDPAAVGGADETVVCLPERVKLEAAGVSGDGSLIDQ